MPKIPHKNKYLRYIFWVMAIVWAAPGTGAQGAAVSADDGARDYPNRPIRFILPGGPGSSADVFSRILTAKMSDVMGQQVVVDSRPGAGGMLGTDAIAPYQWPIAVTRNDNGQWYYYARATDTAGAGKWRGASGIHWEVENVGGDAGIATGRVKSCKPQNAAEPPSSNHTENAINRASISPL